MTVIKPTVGRVVHYVPHLNDAVAKSPNDQPHVALIAHVWTDECVNLAVFDSNGLPYQRTSVLLVQDGNPVPNSGGYARWMPYQVAQAGIAPILEAVAAEAGGSEPLLGVTETDPAAIAQAESAQAAGSADVSTGDAPAAVGE